MSTLNGINDVEKKETQNNQIILSKEAAKPKPKSRSPAKRPSVQLNNDL